MANNKNSSTSYNVDYYLSLKKKQKQKYVKNLTEKQQEKLKEDAKKRKKEIEKNEKMAKNYAIVSYTNSVSNYDLSSNLYKIKEMIPDESSMNGIEGMPYQFMESVDRRPTGLGIGRKFAEKIYSRMPLVFLTPCKQVPFADFDDGDTENILAGLQNPENFTIDFIKEEGRYYTTQYDYETYYNYLNPMLSAMAGYLGIGDVELKVGNNTRKKIDTIDWSSDVNDKYKQLFSAKMNLVFYANELNNISESFGNDTMESSLIGTLNSFSDQAKELEFLLGGGVANTLVESAKDATASVTKSLSGLATNLGGGIIGSLTKNGINTIVNQGKILFPKLWSDSNHNTSYSVNFKFRSPDNDNLSIFLNILKPYAKLLTLVLPRAAEENVNGYKTPHLVKATSPGFFHIDMGLITGMSVSKGEEGEWNDDGLPTVLDVSLDIENLYDSVLYMSGVTDESIVDILNPLDVLKDAGKFVTNTAYMDFLANTCGVDIHKPSIQRILTNYFMFVKNDFLRIPTKLTTHLDNAITNVIGNMYNNFTS